MSVVVLVFELIQTVLGIISEALLSPHPSTNPLIDEPNTHGVCGKKTAAAVTGTTAAELTSFQLVTRLRATTRPAHAGQAEAQSHQS